MNDTPPTLPPSRAARLRINPVLVKELRQGVRSKLYTAVFIAIQVVMMLYLLLITANRQTRGNDSVEIMFWWLIGLFLLVCLPLTGANALNSENRASRLELLLLTGLSSRRIVYGKWMAIIAQGVLLASALLPYLVLRYYIDSSEFHRSLFYILLMLVSSAVLTGMTVSLSVIRTGILRWFLLVFGVLFVLPSVISSLFMHFSYMNSLYSELPLLLLMGILIVSLSMEFAATRFNPIEANHDTAKRLLLWTMVAVSLFGLWRNAEFELIYIAAAACTVVVVWDGLCRPPSPSPTIYEPFVRRGRLGRAAGWLLYPGWPSALLFGLLTLAILCVPVFHHALTCTTCADGHLIKMWLPVLLIGVLLFPFALAQCFAFGRRRTGITMLMIQLMLVLLTTLLHLVDKATGTQSVLAIAWIPTCALLLEIMNDAITDANGTLLAVIFVGCTITTATSLLFVLLRAAPQRRFICAMQRQAQNNLNARCGRTDADATATGTAQGQPDSLRPASGGDRAAGTDNRTAGGSPLEQ